MDLGIILTSSVIVAIVGAFASVLTTRKANNLKYITEERKEWRKEIREIAKDINTCSQFQIKEKILPLKVRINAYGYIESAEGINYYQDEHIWKIMKRLETNDLEIQEYDRYKNILEIYLSLLLKYDWERSKREVEGSKTGMIQLFISVVSFFSVIFVYHYLFQNPVDETMILILTWAFFPCITGIVEKAVMKVVRKVDRKGPIMLGTTISFVACNVSLMVMMIEKISEGSFITILIILGLFFSGTALSLSRILNTIIAENQYKIILKEIERKTF